MPVVLGSAVFWSARAVKAVVKTARLFARAAVRNVLSAPIGSVKNVKNAPTA